MSLYEEVQELKQTVASLERRLKEKEDQLTHVRNAPIIVAYAGKRLLLNYELDAQYVVKTIQDHESRIAALE
jgi:cell division septum initiation protein DivIVA